MWKEDLRQGRVNISSGNTTLTHPNKKRGNNYEYRFMKKRIKEGATDVIRHYGSLGATDVEWTDKNGQRHEAQLKFSSKVRPGINLRDWFRLKEYAESKPKIKIWLVTKQSLHKEEWKQVA